MLKTFTLFFPQVEGFIYASHKYFDMVIQQILFIDTLLQQILLIDTRLYAVNDGTANNNVMILLMS